MGERVRSRRVKRNKSFRKRNTLRRKILHKRRHFKRRNTKRTYRRKMRGGAPIFRRRSSTPQAGDIVEFKNKDRVPGICTPDGDMRVIMWPAEEERGEELLNQGLYRLECVSTPAGVEKVLSAPGKDLQQKRS